LPHFALGKSANLVKPTIAAMLDLGRQRSSLRINSLKPRRHSKSYSVTLSNENRSSLRGKLLLCFPVL
jgi:hypothetical protein